jgi:adenylate kinase family enzyme
MQRILVVGTSGSGKTQMARALSVRLGLPHFELDALHWEPNWTETPTDRLRERVLAATAGAGWIVDGNYSKIRDILWPRADTVVWLDFSLPVVLWRVTARTFRRMWTGEVLWSGNRESARLTFFSRHSILLWALQTHALNRRRYSALFQDPTYAHLAVVRLCTPRAAEDWLRGLPSPGPLGRAATGQCGDGLGPTG